MWRVDAAAAPPKRSVEGSTAPNPRHRLDAPLAPPPRSYRTENKGSSYQNEGQAGAKTTPSGRSSLPFPTEDMSLWRPETLTTRERERERERGTTRICKNPRGIYIKGARWGAKGGDENHCVKPRAVPLKPTQQSTHRHQIKVLTTLQAVASPHQGRRKGQIPGGR